MSSSFIWHGHLGCVHVLAQIVNMGFPGGACDKESACQCRIHKRLGFNLWLWEDPLEEGGHGSPLQYSCLEIPWIEEPGGSQVDGSDLART